jgi:hypothetical protein
VFPVNPKFRVLRALAIVSKILAWVALAWGVIVFFISLVMAGLFGRWFISGVAGAFLGLACGILIFIGLYAWAEIIYVLLSIEDSAAIVAKRLSEE